MASSGLGNPIVRATAALVLLSASSMGQTASPQQESELLTSEQQAILFMCELVERSLTDALPEGLLAAASLARTVSIDIRRLPEAGVSESQTGTPLFPLEYSALLDSAESMTAKLKDDARREALTTLVLRYRKMAPVYTMGPGPRKATFIEIGSLGPGESRKVQEIYKKGDKPVPTIHAWPGQSLASIRVSDDSGKEIASSLKMGSVVSCKLDVLDADVTLSIEVTNLSSEARHFKLFLFLTP